MSNPRSQWRTISGREMASPAPHVDVRCLLLADVERLIAKARESNLKQVVLALNLARLELKMQIHNVSESELHALGRLARSELSIEDVLS